MSNVIIPPSVGIPLATPNHKWELFRVPTSEDGAAAHDLTADALDASTIIQSREHVAVTDGIVDLRQLFTNTGNGVEIAFFTEDDSALDTFDFELFAYRNGLYGPAKRVFSTTGNACIIGTMICTKHPITGTAQASGLWCDTISGTSYWPKDAAVYDSANNQTALLVFDTRGYSYLYIRIFNAGGGGTECAKIGAIISAL